MDRIISVLEKENYLNEDRYCESFIHDKLYFNKWGKLKIAQALYFKKIPDRLIQHHLNEINNEDIWNFKQIIRKQEENYKSKK